MYGEFDVEGSLLFLVRFLKIYPDLLLIQVSSDQDRKEKRKGIWLKEECKKSSFA